MSSLFLVDSSIWIDAHRRATGRNAIVLKKLLDLDEVALALPVRLELLAGVSRRDRMSLQRGLSSLPVLQPTEGTWRQIDRWLPIAADRGHRFGLADWLIAALANEIDALIWSLDEDFEQLGRLKMARLYEP